MVKMTGENLSLNLLGNLPIQECNYDVRMYENFDYIYGLFIPSTINTGTQISADRITNKSLCNYGLYTANASLGTKRNGKLLLGIGGNAAFNLIFGTNTKEVIQELRDRRYVHLNSTQRNLILMLEKAGDVVFVEPKSLRLEICHKGGFGHFPIRTNEYEQDSIGAREYWLHAGYNSSHTRQAIMDTLSKNRISEITIYTMDPEDVAEAVKDNEIVARASRLNSFGRASFDTNIYVVGDYDVVMRGILKNFSEGGREIRAYHESQFRVVKMDAHQQRYEGNLEDQIGK